MLQGLFYRGPDEQYAVSADNIPMHGQEQSRFMAMHHGSFDPYAQEHGQHCHNDSRTQPEIQVINELSAEHRRSKADEKNTLSPDEMSYR